MKVLHDHFSPKPIIIAERFRFHKRNQEEGESVAQYVAVLKKLSEHCDFGIHLHDALRDRFVCGLSNESIQRKMLTEETLTFQRAVDISMSMETMAREAEHLKSSLKVHAMFASSPQGGDKCFRCGKSNHKQSDCYYREQPCYSCKRKEHIARMCKNNKRDQKYSKEKYEAKMKPRKQFDKSKRGEIHKVVAKTTESERESTSDSDTELTLHMVTAMVKETEKGMAVKKQNAASSLMKVRPRIEDHLIDMELDTGAAVSLISMELHKTKFAHVRLRKTDVVLKTYTGEVLLPEGMLKVWVKLNKQLIRLPLYVVKGNSPSLLGREWLRKIKLKWREIKTITAGCKPDETLENVLKCHVQVFSETLGTLKGFETFLTLKPGQHPKFCQARVVPYALRPKVEAEIDRLLQQEVIFPVQFSDWAAPIVPVIKKSGSVRICRDFKVTINPALCVEHYPIPRIEDLFASLSGGHRFSKLDLSQAYLQVPVCEESRKYLTITTHKGLFRFNRLPFRITSAPAIFQKIMDQVLQGLPNVHCLWTTSL